jgi:hypothetical protein
VAVATVMETADDCCGRANDVGADGITFGATAGAETTAVGATTSAANGARTPWRFWRGVAHIVQYLPPLSEEVRAPHSQPKAEEEEAMMGGLWVLVVRVVCGVVCAGCVCAASPCCFVRLTRISAPKNLQTTAYIGDHRKALSETNQTITFN